MQRIAFKMKLKAGAAAEYQKRHDAIWPELATALAAAGISDYSIFLDEEAFTLFAVHKLGEENSTAELPNLPVVRRWWESMAPLMEVQADNSPVSRPLREGFHLE